MWDQPKFSPTWIIIQPMIGKYHLCIKGSLSIKWQ